LNHYRDLAFILILDILSIIWLITPSLNSYPSNIIPYLLLIFILPGYSLLAVLKPTLNQMGVKGRSIFSVNLSILITLLIIIALNQPPLTSLFNALAALTFFLTIVGFMRRRTGFEEHDLQVKLRHIRKFLEENNKVKITMMFRGREIAYAEIGRKIMEGLIQELGDIGNVDQQPKLEGRNMVMIVAPKK